MLIAQDESGLTECAQATPAGVLRALLTSSGPGRTFDPPEPISVVDSEGLPLGTLGTFRRCNLQSHQVPRLVQACFVLSEDRRFWRHRGIDSLAILRAFATNLRRGAVKQGGSTITQQLVKNFFFKHMPRWQRKLPEVVVALMLERRLPKQVILVSYLNTIYFGGRTYGLAEAARAHYRKEVVDLEPSEAAVLASLVRAPNFYLSEVGRPYLMRRAQRLLDRMHVEGHLTKCYTVRLPLRPRRRRAAHSRRQLERQGLIGLARVSLAASARRDGEQPVARIRVAAQLRLQHRIHAILGGAGVGSSHAAVIALRIEDRSVLATAAVPYTLDLATRGRVQPGSSLKPFILAAALEAGYRLSDRFDSAEVVLNFPGRTPWHVRNHGDRYHGAIDLCTALALSDNVVFARLMQRLSPDHVAEVLERFGVRLHKITPAAALGAVEEGVRPLDLLNAYATLAAGGVYRPVRYVVSASDRSGVHRSAVIAAATQATSLQVARDVGFALRQAAAYGPAAVPLRNVAAKTGTAARDQLVCAFQEDIAALIWMGRPHGAHEIEKGLSPTRLLAQLASALFATQAS